MEVDNWSLLTGKKWYRFSKRGYSCPAIATNMANPLGQTK